MKKLFSLGAMLCLFFAVTAQETGAKLDSLISAYNRLQKFNGTVLVAMQGNVLLSKGYGYRNATNKTVNDEHSIFQLGSITKQFTAAVILKLQEEKKLSVADKISKYLPGFPKGDSITIEHLLTHTSGIFNYTNDKDFMNTEVSKPKTREQMIALFKDKPLDFSPGSAWNYSNSGYSLLGYIIEDVAKTSYEQAIRKYIFTPVQMTHSGFDFMHLQDAHKTTGYIALNTKETNPAPVVDSSVSYAAGSVYSTTGDLYRWHRALQSNSILSKAQQELAYTPVKNRYGYGWKIDSIQGKRRVGHGGGIDGFVTNLSRVPEDDICIVLLSNASDRSLEQITNSIYAILYNKEYELPRERKAIMLPAAVMQQYTGEYEIRPGLTVAISVKDNGLAAQPTGQSEKFILPEKEDMFFDTGDDVQLQFTRNEQKEVDGFVLIQRGRKTVCKKIK